jgi:hypothetical protein
VERLREEALRTVRAAKTPDAVAAALDTLPDGDADVREALLARYRALGAQPSRRDPGCHLRVALLQGLRRHALPADVDVLEAAVRTYEMLPPGPQEVAGGLRGAALLALSDLDDRLASFHAVRLMADPYTSRQSGEPAVTAVRLLAAQRQTLPLYQHLLRGEAAGEVALECLRALTEAPASVVQAVAEESRRRRDELVLLGLVDLLLGHPEKERLAPILIALVTESEQMDVVRYAAAAIVAGREPTLIEGLRSRAGLAGRRGELVREALALLPGARA